MAKQSRKAQLKRIKQNREQNRLEQEQAQRQMECEWRAFRQKQYAEEKAQRQTEKAEYIKGLNEAEIKAYYAIKVLESVSQTDIISNLIKCHDAIEGLNENPS